MFGKNSILHLSLRKLFQSKEQMNDEYTDSQDVDSITSIGDEITLNLEDITTNKDIVNTNKSTKKCEVYLQLLNKQKINDLKKNSSENSIKNDSNEIEKTDKKDEINQKCKSKEGQEKKPIKGKKEKNTKVATKSAKEKKKLKAEEINPPYPTRSTRLNKEKKVVTKKAETKVRKPRKVKTATISSTLAAVKQADKRSAEMIQPSADISDIPYPKGLNIIELSNMKQQFVIENLSTIDTNSANEERNSINSPDSEIDQPTQAKKMKTTELDIKKENKSLGKLEIRNETSEIIHYDKVEGIKASVYDFNLHSDYGNVFNLYKN